MNLQEAKAITGGLSRPSKMPGYCYNIPAKKCIRGNKLRMHKGSVCHECYALKGRYPIPNVQAAMERRLEAFEHPLFGPAMVKLISHYSPKYFRWFDSGDLQSASMLETIIDIAEALPDTLFWLPTREEQIVSVVRIRGRTIPPNLIIRLSADYIGDVPTLTDQQIKDGIRGSCVNDNDNPHILDKGVYYCPALKQGNQCGDCRACWDTNILHVSYRRH